MAFEVPDVSSYLNAMMQYWGPLMNAAARDDIKVEALFLYQFQHGTDSESLGRVTYGGLRVAPGELRPELGAFTA